MFKDLLRWSSNLLESIPEEVRFKEGYKRFDQAFRNNFGKIERYLTNEIESLLIYEDFLYAFELFGSILQKETYSKIEAKNDIVIIEGAGSPAEINIKEEDISNFAMARIADAPVILVADIDRGGVFASIYGTIMLLKDQIPKHSKEKCKSFYQKNCGRNQ